MLSGLGTVVLGSLDEFIGKKMGEIRISTKALVDYKLVKLMQTDH